MNRIQFSGLVTLVLALPLPRALAADAPAPTRLVIRADQGKDTINRNIYGQFSEHLGHCIYEGLWVGEDSPIPNTRGIRNDVVTALKRIKVPLLRWPGGCFADEYHWKDGIGPKDQRPTMINTHWGGVTENNHFGTHEFLDLCEQLGCEPYLCGNVGSGAVSEMQQWVEYITFPGVSPMADLRAKNGHPEPWKLKYFAVGNENWGCGGNMTAEFYADQYKRYATYVRNFGDNRIFKVACGPGGEDYHWTEVLMREAGRRMDALALHYYCGSGKKSHSATRFDEEDWFFQLKNALHIEDLVNRNSEIMDKYDPQRRVALAVDEWGAWHHVEPGTNPGFLFQQNSLRDALVAGSSLNIFNNHAARVRLANIAQMINVLQAMILTDKEKIILTPTYHVFEMYTVHHDATLLPTELASADYSFGSERIPAVNASASRDGAGKVHVTLCNLNPNAAAEVTCDLQGAKATKLSGRVLTAPEMTAHNTFDQPENLKPAEFSAFKTTETGFGTTLPPKSVVVLEIE
ncbi:MAG TPA: alpha-N-arabinofuranosidase [Candidatus Acidoferrum sp.]|nr:alpha-N-arabinofuranosidase [Candidatus Acidoferrum sp.]